MLVVGLLLTIRLGVWQLNRADEKRLIVKASTEPSVASTLTPDGMPPAPFQKLRVTGTYLANNPLLLDNQLYQHKLGYQVLSLFKLSDGSLVLLNRGWVEKPKEAGLLALTRPTGTQRLKVSAYYPSSKQWLLGEFLSSSEGDYQVIETLDLSKIEALLGVKLKPYVLRLKEGEKGGYVCEWATANLTPEKHLAYALQWFSFAVVIFSIFLCLTVRPL